METKDLYNDIISSPYVDIKNKYLFMGMVSNFVCYNHLGIENFNRAINISSSASGMILSIGTLRKNQVFIKIFPTINKYDFILFRGKIRKVKKTIFDPNIVEIGITKTLSDILFMNNPSTQNLIAVYGINSCKMAYQPGDDESENYLII